MRWLIVNGDDFGASRGINRGILEAHRNGVLTSASLMVNMPASEEAARLAHEAPGLSVGIHVNFTNEGGPPLAIGDGSAVPQERVAPTGWRAEREAPADATDYAGEAHDVALLRRYGWQVRDAREVLSALFDAAIGGFTATGSE